MLPLQLILHVAEPVEGRSGFGEPEVVVVRGSPAHGVGGILETPGGIHHLGRVLLAGQALEPARRFLHFLGELPLGGATAALGRLLPARPHPLPFGLTLLAPCELAQPLHELIHGVVGLLLLATLHRLVLVLQLVQLELEQVRQILGRLALPSTATAATAATAAHLDHDLLIGFLGSLEVLKRSLFGRQGAIGILFLQLVLSGTHGLSRLWEDFGDGTERGVRGHDPAVHPPEQCLDLLAQLPLSKRQKDDVLPVFVGRIGIPIADHVERSGNDFLLRRGECARVGTATAGATAATLRRRGSKVSTERANLDKVQIALDVLVLLREVAVGRPCVVGQEVTWLEVEILEEERCDRQRPL